MGCHEKGLVHCPCCRSAALNGATQMLMLGLNETID